MVRLGAERDEGLRLAALTHDIERHFPGGPEIDLEAPPDDRRYRDAHQRRSADIVAEWLEGEGADPELVRDVRDLVLVHEWGGGSRENLLQAADSLSFLELNWAIVASWVERGACSKERGAAQLAWMLDRIQVAAARAEAQPLYADALARLCAGDPPATGRQ